ncbi:MAG: DUF4386 domain-containing protein [Terriglobales bacterium]
MSAAVMLERIAEASPRSKTRIAGVLNLLTILTGIFASFMSHGRWSFVAELFAALCNIVVTLLLYDIFRPVNRGASLLAACFGLVVSAMGALQWHPGGVDVGLMAFGVYCLLIGYLIFRSTFLPRILGALVAFAGLAWLTVLSPPLTSYLSPYNMAAGILGQISLTLWLLVMGVNVQRWNEQAGASRV